MFFFMLAAFKIDLPVFHFFSLVSSDLNSFYNLTKSSIENIGVNINFDPDVRIITPPWPQLALYFLVDMSMEDVRPVLKEIFLQEYTFSPAVRMETCSRPDSHAIHQLLRYNLYNEFQLFSSVYRSRLFRFHKVYYPLLIYSSSSSCIQLSNIRLKAVLEVATPV